jgi:hypothetical protein
VAVVLAAAGIAATATACEPAPAPYADLTLASVRPDGTKGDQPVRGMGLAADGGSLTFATGSGLEPGAPVGTFRHDLASGAVTEAVVRDGTGRSYGGTVVSGDGTLTALYGGPLWVVPPERPSSAPGQVYVLDLDAGTWRDGGPAGPSGGPHPVELSDDGAKVLVGDQDAAVWVWDSVTGTCEWPSSPREGEPLHGSAWDGSMSADGGVVAWTGYEPDRQR